MSNFDEIFIKEMSSIDAYNYGRQEAEKELNEIHLCECNQIKAEAYMQGAKEFAEWLYAKANVPIYDYYGRKTKTDDLLAEWQKERI